MTANAETAGAREARIAEQARALKEVRDRAAFKSDYIELDEIITALSPKVRATAKLSHNVDAELMGDTVTLYVQGKHRVYFGRKDHEILAALDARADAEGFVVEEVECCECGHERGDHGPKMWGCAHCPCTEYEARTPAPDPTPSASPEACDCGHPRGCHNALAESVGRRSCSLCPCMAYGAGRPSQHSASPEADGRVWWIRKFADGSWSCAPFEPAAWSESIPVVPRSELARVRRERDDLLVGIKGITEAFSPDANMSYYMLDRANYLLSGKRDAIESHFAGYRAELDYQKAENATLRAQLATAEQKLDTALERALVAEQNLAGVRGRIETGAVLWRDRGGDVWDVEPTDEDFVFGPFTRGRFVADEEDKA